jgi:CBS domain-containing protein
MTLVLEFNKERGNAVLTVDPDATVLDAVRSMADNDVGALVVVEDRKVIGIITERIYARSIILKGRASAETPVREIMERQVAYARPDNTIEDCMAIMTRLRVRHLPIMRGDELVGIISQGDVVKSIISEREFVIDQLVQFIKGY